MKPLIVGALLGASLLFAPLAYASTASVPVGDPYTDTIQLWSEIASALSSLANGIGTIFDGHEVAANNPKAPSNQQEAASLAAAAAVPAFESASNTPATSTEPAPITTSYQTTDSPNVKSADLSILTPPATSNNSSLSATLASNFVTQDQLAAQLLQLSNSLNSQINSAQFLTVPGWAASQQIGQLDNVTITNANLTASEIPDLSGSYLSLNGGSLNGALLDTATSSSYFLGALGIGTTSPATSLSTTGSGYFTAGLGIGVLNTAPGTLQTSGNATIGGTLTVGSTSAPFFGQAVNSFDGLQFAVAQNGLGNPSGTMTGYNAGDMITLQCTGVTFAVKPVVGVSAVSGGHVTDAIVTNSGVTSGNVPSGTATCSQASTSGSGAGYSVSVTFGIIAAYLAPASLGTGGASDNGNLFLNTGGSSDAALFLNAGAENTFLGDKAGIAFLGASSYSTAIGHNACGNGGSGGVSSNDTCVGDDAGRNEQGTGSNNTFVGAGAGRNNAAQNNTFVGSAAGSNSNVNNPGNTSGGGNTAVGASAGNALTSGNTNTFYGQSAGGTDTSGSWNTFIGAGAGNSSTSTTGYNNVAFGFDAGNALMSGLGNLFLGTKAGSAVTTGSGNIIMGATSGGDNCANGNTSNYFAVCPGAGPVLTVTGGATPATSVASIPGFLGVGTSTPYSRLTVWGTDAASSTLAFNVVNSASTTVFAVFDGGNAELSGSLSQSSDERLKTNIQSLGASSSLSLIDELNPVTFNWIDPNQTTTLQLGFIAQQVQQIFPNLVSTTSATALTPDGTLSLNYIGLISPIVSAIQALSAEITSVESTIAGFAQSFTTHILTSDDVTANNELCVGSTCVTPAQFQAIVAAAGESGRASDVGDAASSDSQATDTPPQIQINGDNPAIVQIGDTYNDLGATITGPTADLNLGITTYANGIETSPVQIDTSAAATDTIDYVVTDQNGLTSTSTRTVIIEASPSVVPTDDVDSGSAPDTDETASTSTATSTAQ